MKKALLFLTVATIAVFFLVAPKRHARSVKAQTAPYTCSAGVTSYSTTSASVLTNAGTTVSIVGINIVSLGASAMPYSLFLCGV